MTSTALDDAAARAERFFMGKGEVHAALRRLRANLDAIGVPYAIAGAMALNAHGYERTTVDVDVLLTREGLERFKAAYLGRGYVEKFPGSRGVRDTESNVNIDVLVTGDYPGDGKDKPVRFPDPSAFAGGVLPVPTLIELKLASGMSAPHRLKDLADVLELIKAASLPLELSLQLDASVRAKYEELWLAAQTRDPE